MAKRYSLKDSIWKGEIKTAKPKIKVPLATIEPINLPATILCCLTLRALIERTSSGKTVPKVESVEETPKTETKKGK